MPGSSRGGLLHEPGADGDEEAGWGSALLGASGPDPQEWLQGQSLGSASHFQTRSQRQILGPAGKPSRDQQDKGASTGLPVASPGRDQRQGLKQKGVAPTRPLTSPSWKPVPGYSCPVSEPAAEYKQPDTARGASSGTASELCWCGTLLSAHWRGWEQSEGTTRVRCTLTASCSLHMTLLYSPLRWSANPVSQTSGRMHGHRV